METYYLGLSVPRSLICCMSGCGSLDLFCFSFGSLQSTFLCHRARGKSSMQIATCSTSTCSMSYVCFIFNNGALSSVCEEQPRGISQANSSIKCNSIQYQKFQFVTRESSLGLCLLHYLAILFRSSHICIYFRKLLLIQVSIPLLK